MTIRLACRCLATAPIFLAGILSCAACRTACIVEGATASRAFSQVATERPPGVGRARYLRAWRRGHAAGDVEVTADGRARLMSPAAWQRHGASTPMKKAKPITTVVDLDAVVLQELGLGPRKVGT